MAGEERQKITVLKKQEYPELRHLIETYYDLQKLRVSVENRIRAYSGAGLMRYTDFDYMDLKLRELEKSVEKKIEKIIKVHPLWNMWFDRIKGIGPILAASIIAWCDIEKAKTVSSMWKYFGLAPGQERKRGEKAGYNPKAKTLAWKIAQSLLRAKGRYTSIYYKAKSEYERREDIRKMHENGEARGGMNSYKVHVHLMSLRKMVKRFLADTWVVWRKVEDLPITKPYVLSEYAREKGIAHELEHYEPPTTDDGQVIVVEEDTEPNNPRKPWRKSEP